MPENSQQTAEQGAQPAEKDMTELSIDFLVSDYGFTRENAERFMNLYRQQQGQRYPRIDPEDLELLHFLQLAETFRNYPPPVMGPIGRPIAIDPRTLRPGPYFSPSNNPGVFRAAKKPQNNSEAADALAELKKIEADYRKGLCLDEAAPFGITVEDEYVGDIDRSKIVVKDGVLRAPVRIAAAMVQDYNGVKVLKCYKELQKAADFAKQLPITHGHPPEKVVTSQDQIKGWTTPPTYVEADRAIDCTCETTDSKLIKAVTDDGLTDVSIGFHCDLVMDKGEYNGQHYDAIQTNIVLNHVAMGIRKGRCPSGTCGLGMGTQKTDGADMKFEKELTPEEIAKLSPEDKKAYEEWLMMQKKNTEMTGAETNEHPTDCTCDACKKKKKMKDQPAESVAPAQEPPMPEKGKEMPPATPSTELTKAVDAFGKLFVEIMSKRTTMSAEELTKAFNDLTALLGNVKTIVEKEKGAEKKDTAAIERADALLIMAEPSLKELAKTRDDIIAKVDAIMDLKPSQPRAEYEKMNDEALTNAKAELTKKKPSTSDSLSGDVDPIDRAYAAVLEKRR